MTAGSSMLAMILTCPPPCSQLWDFDTEDALESLRPLMDTCRGTAPRLTRGFGYSAVALAQAPGRRRQIRRAGMTFLVRRKKRLHVSCET
jgi:hypothetical protein